MLFYNRNQTFWSRSFLEVSICPGTFLLLRIVLDTLEHYEDDVLEDCKTYLSVYVGEVTF